MSKEPSPKELFVSATIAALKSGKVAYYERSGNIYVDTACCGGTELVLLRSGSFTAFILDLAHTTQKIMLRATDAELIVDQVTAYADRNALPLSNDPRARIIDGVLWLNPAWKNGKLIRIAAGAWSIEEPPCRIFAPLPPSMAMPVPVQTPASEFGALMAKGITSFGDYHCFYCTTMATTMMPQDDVHPIIILSGEGAKGKSTTMKLSTQLVDPDEGNECMIVSEDQRNILAACLTRKTIGLDNTSKLPISDDLLSQMYAGGVSKERKLYTNNELSHTKIERMRVFINGVSPDFTKSDFFTKAIFLEQPVVTRKNAAGKDRYDSLSAVEREWKAMLPVTLGSLLSVIASGLPYYNEWVEKRAKSGRRPDAAVRFVEFAVMGEAFARAMGYPPDTFTGQVEALSEKSKQTAADSDECTQLIVKWAEGKRGTTFGGSDDVWGSTSTTSAYPKADRYDITTSDLHAELQALAKVEGYNTYKMSWINNPVWLGRHLRKSLQTINNSEWYMIPKARHGAGWIIERKATMKENGEKVQDSMPI